MSKHRDTRIQLPRLIDALVPFTRPSAGSDWDDPLGRVPTEPRALEPAHQPPIPTLANSTVGKSGSASLAGNRARRGTGGPWLWLSIALLSGALGVWGAISVLEPRLGLGGVKLESSPDVAASPQTGASQVAPLREPSTMGPAGTAELDPAAEPEVRSEEDEGTPFPSDEPSLSEPASKSSVQREARDWQSLMRRGAGKQSGANVQKAARRKGRTERTATPTTTAAPGSEASSAPAASAPTPAPTPAAAAPASSGEGTRRGIQRDDFLVDRPAASDGETGSSPPTRRKVSASDFDTAR